MVKNHTFNDIKVILLNEWDPIGIKNIDGASDEYDMYVEDVLNFALENKSEGLLEKFLLQIETDNMGLSGNVENNRRVSQIILNYINKRSF